MSETTAVLWVIVLLALRIGLPLAFTFGGAYLLNRLYSRLDPDYVSV